MLRLLREHPDNFILPLPILLGIALLFSVFLMSDTPGPTLVEASQADCQGEGLGVTVKNAQKRVMIGVRCGETVYQITDPEVIRASAPGGFDRPFVCTYTANKALIACAPHE